MTRPPTRPGIDADAAADPADVLTDETTERGGRFLILRDGRRLGELAWTARDREIVIMHTEVDPSLRGTGAGRRLVDAVVAFARAERRRIVPVCPYARSVLQRGRQYADVLARHDVRAGTR